MQQESIILFIDLDEEAESFGGTLASQGLKAVPVSLAEAEAGIVQGQPRVILAPQIHSGVIAAILRKADLPAEIPFFTLGSAGDASKASPLKEVTARLPKDIDGGVLCLRLSTVLGQAPLRRASQPTLLGVGQAGELVSASEHQSTPPVSASSPPPLAGASPSSPAPVSQQPSLSSPAPVPESLAAPPESAPFLAESSEASEAAAVATSASSAPVLAPEISPQVVTSAAPVPEPALDSASVASAPVAAAPEGSSSPPVITSAPSKPTDLNAEIAMMAQAQAASKSKTMKRGAAALALVLLAGGGILLSGGEEEASVESAEAETKKIDQAAAPLASTAEKETPVAPVLPVKAKPDEGAEAKADEKADAIEADEETESQGASGSEASFYKIDSLAKIDSCEDVLEKPKSYYEQRKAWRGAQSWKLSRKALMSGKEKEAHKRMCESAFIDPKGPATLGLARYYLARRDLAQAEKWAKLGIEVSPKAKRTARELLGDVYCQRGQMAKARETWLESFNLKEDDTARLAAVVRRFLKAARSARRGGDAPLAERHLRRAAAFDPKSSDTAAALASILLKTGEKKLAKLWADQALELNSGSKVAKAVLSQL